MLIRIGGQTWSDKEVINDVRIVIYRGEETKMI